MPPQRRNLLAGLGRESLPAGKVRIEGYAVAYDRRVSRVEVSVNGGRDWLQAEFADDPEARWSWRRWSLDATLAKGRQHLVGARLRRSGGRGQPERPDTMWELRRLPLHRLAPRSRAGAMNSAAMGARPNPSGPMRWGRLVVATTAGMVLGWGALAREPPDHGAAHARAGRVGELYRGAGDRA